MPPTTFDVAAGILGEVSRQIRRHASPEAQMLSVHLLERKISPGSCEEIALNLPWGRALPLFAPRTVAAWDVAACRASWFLKMAFAALAYQDESGRFRRLIGRNIASRKIPEEVRALLVVWQARDDFENNGLEPPDIGRAFKGRPGFGDSEELTEGLAWIDRYRGYPADSPAVQALVVGDTSVIEQALRTDGIRAGCSNLARICTHRLTHDLIAWLVVHAAFNTLAHLVDMRDMLPVAYGPIVAAACATACHPLRGDNTEAFLRLMKAVARRRPEVFASYADAEGNTLFWSVLALACTGTAGRTIALSRCNILRRFGCLPRKPNGKGITWESVEREIARQ